MLDINNADTTPEPNVQKKFFLRSFIHFLWAVKNDVFFRKTFYLSLFPDSDSPVHGESNDRLCVSKRSKLMEKLNSAETCFEKSLPKN